MPWVIFIASATAIVIAATQLAKYGDIIAIRTRLGGMFVGVLLMAGATSLPEVLTTINAVSQSVPNLAAGNLLGSNLFNVTIIAVDDLFYRPGALLADVSLVHAVTATSAIVMTGLAVVGLFFRPRDRVLRAVGAISLALTAVYLLNTYVIFLHGT